MDALSPLDGRYARKVDALRPFFSEGALIRARVFIEVSWYAALAANKDIRELKTLSKPQEKALQDLVSDFSEKDMHRVKEIEKTTNHDVKAVEYFLREKFAKLKLPASFIHFALTSEDVNNLAYGVLINTAIAEVILPDLLALDVGLKALAKPEMATPMLSLTHGQPATPTTVGKELMVFSERLQRQASALAQFRMHGKFGGAVGTYAAHRAAYPDIDWEEVGQEFIASLGLTPLTHTTQINPHDDIAEFSHAMIRINTILLDLTRDAWSYISRGVFKQRVMKGEVGSSTMPHKVNPIDFENAEGNLGISSALFDHFALKLPVSRLQRDLSDSTVQRSIGVAVGHHTLAVQTVMKGLQKLSVNPAILKAELAAHPELVAEAIQTVMRKHGIDDAYEQMKKLTRGENISAKDLRAFIDKLAIPAGEKKRLLGLL